MDRIVQGAFPGGLHDSDPPGAIWILVENEPIHAN